ncbi:hypothetical protein AM202_0167 [Actinobacillus minor 202]|uniref:Uncharacterized protein n=1 Tax=Actinobacillus minor 202 TaxID=591023 RepID=A0ABP2DNW6_9PAST|nr:hypothetical protein AM202_0167 [Actinobacillus minor 202]
MTKKNMTTLAFPSCHNSFTVCQKLSGALTSIFCNSCKAFSAFFANEAILTAIALIAIKSDPKENNTMPTFSRLQFGFSNSGNPKSAKERKSTVGVRFLKNPK